MQQLGSLVLAESPLPHLLLPVWREIPWLVHGWSTRLGGVSRGAQAGLNIGYARDERELVDQNRALWRGALGLAELDDVYMQQVHSSNVAVATVAGSLPETDGVLTFVPGLALHVLVADCLPILLLCRERRAVGAVHAGWRGTMLGIVQEAVRKMAAEYSVSPEQIEACIGPGIGACCYLVDAPVIEQVMALPIDWQLAVRSSTVSGQWYLDLALVNRLLLLAAGLPDSQIYLSGLCTAHDATHFFSHRRDRGDTGRLVATIGIIPRDDAGFAATGREVLRECRGNGDEIIVG